MMNISMLNLKTKLREGLLEPDERRQLWPILTTLHTYKSNEAEVIDVEVLYDAWISKASRLADILKAPWLRNERFLVVAEGGVLQSTCDISILVNRILTLLESHNKTALWIDEGSYLHTLVKVLLWQLQRADFVYLMLSEIIKEESKFGPFDTSYTAMMSDMLTVLLQRYMPKTYSTCPDIGTVAYSGVYFCKLFSSLLPSSGWLAVVDSFLLEGNKVLFRYALGFIGYYKRDIKGGRWSSVDTFYADVVVEDDISRVLGLHASTVNSGTIFTTHSGDGDNNNSIRNGNYGSGKGGVDMSKLRGLAYDKDRLWVRRMTRPMPISRDTLSSLRQQRDRLGSLAVGLSVTSPRMDSEEDSSDSPKHTPSLASHYLTTPQCKQLLSTVLPHTLSNTTRPWHCVHRCGVNGWDLNTLYHSTDKAKATLIIFHLLPPNNDIVLGGLCGGSLVVKGGVSGSGAVNRVFRYDKTEDKATCYKWDRDSDNHTYTLCRERYLLFGQSTQHLTSALRLDSDNMHQLHSGYSDTYANPPLVGEDHQTVALEDIEVFVC